MMLICILIEEQKLQITEPFWQKKKSIDDLYEREKIQLLEHIFDFYYSTFGTPKENNLFNKEFSALTGLLLLLVS